jgi:hypothetical protein
MNNVRLGKHYVGEQNTSQEFPDFGIDKIVTGKMPHQIIFLSKLQYSLVAG